MGALSGRPALVLVLALLACTATARTMEGGQLNLKAMLPKTFNPANTGAWRSGYNTANLFLIHNNLMKDGTVVGWSTTDKTGFGTAQCDVGPGSKGCKRILGKGGISDGKNAFCSGQVVTADSHIVMFGGHAGDIEWLRHYDHNAKKVDKMPLHSGRWYPGAATLPDGKLIMVAGVAKSGCSYGGTFTSPICAKANNPTYAIYDPKSRYLSPDKLDMAEQLKAAFPQSTYPTVGVLPDGNLFVSAKKSLYKYVRTDNWFTFKKAYRLPDRPGAPWAYPNTGQGTLLPINPPYTTVELISTGGATLDNATPDTPASDEAWKIDVAGGPEQTWQDIGPMPNRRVMGDAVILCDGTIGFFNGGHSGTAGWSGKPITFKYRDGTKYACKGKCSKANRDGVWTNLEPTIYSPTTGLWSKLGTMASAVRPRLYHSSALLLPSCEVMVSGSDVTNDTTAEFFSPPYLFMGPRPKLINAPDDIFPGDVVVAKYASAAPVTKALLIRAGASTHSMQFDARALWLNVKANNGQEIHLETPPSSNLLPPGLYMLVLNTAQGVPSNGHLLSIRSKLTAKAAKAAKH